MCFAMLIWMAEGEVGVWRRITGGDRAVSDVHLGGLVSRWG